jgi:hypothetical protein
MHRYRELDRTERRSGVPSDPRTRVDNKLADLVCNFLKVFDAKPAKVRRRINFR